MDHRSSKAEERTSKDCNAIIFHPLHVNTTFLDTLMKAEIAFRNNSKLKEIGHTHLRPKNVLISIFEVDHSTYLKKFKNSKFRKRALHAWLAAKKGC